MKKLTGWILVIFYSIILLIFAIALIGIIPGLISGNSKVQMSAKEILTSIFGFLIVVSLLIIGLRNALKKIRKEKTIQLSSYDKQLDINLNGQIKYKDYRNLVLGLSFKKPIYLTVFGLLVLFTLTLWINKENMTTQSNYIYFPFIFIGLFLISPILTIRQIKKLYSSNKIFQEQLKYELTNDSIHITGETVNSFQKWSYFYQFRDTKNFFMFYQGNTIATLIDKKMFSKNDLNEFTGFISSLDIKRV